MKNVRLVGIDLGKHSFHVHGKEKASKAVFCRKLSRKQLVEFLPRFARPRPRTCSITSKCFYNLVRRHGAAGDVSPAEFERRYASNGSRVSMKLWPVQSSS